jgi:hypothetical protein
MKKTSLFALLTLIGICLIVCINIHNIKNIKAEEEEEEPHFTWRNHEWNSVPDSSMYLLWTVPYKSVYCVKNEPLCLGTEKIDSVRYYYYNNKLWRICVYVNTYEESEEEFLYKIAICDIDSKLPTPPNSANFVNTNKIISYYNIKYGSYQRSVISSSNIALVRGYRRGQVPRIGYSWNNSKYSINFIPQYGMIIYTDSMEELKINNELENIRLKDEYIKDSLEKEKLKEEIKSCGI